MKLVFATNNTHKLEEVRQMVGNDIEILSLSDIGCHDDIPETAPTLEGNASMKSHFISERYGVDCFADDTGLEVDALDGRPGVHSARYAYSDHQDSEANVDKLLSELEGKTDRSAQFRTVISLIIGGKEYLFEGVVRGRITTGRSGSAGFGYDPVFCPDGYDETFASLGSEIKNSISHRARAVNELAQFLNGRSKEPSGD